MCDQAQGVLQPVQQARRVGRTAAQRGIHGNGRRAQRLRADGARDAFEGVGHALRQGNILCRQRLPYGGSVALVVWQKIDQYLVQHHRVAARAAQRNRQVNARQVVGQGSPQVRSPPGSE